MKHLIFSGDENITIKDYIKKCGIISDKQPLIYNIDLEKEN